MKVRVSYTVEVTEEFRLALRSYWGQPGKATRKEIQRHFESLGDSTNDDIMAEYQANLAGGSPR